MKKRTATQKLVCATNYAPAQAKLRSAEETKALRFVKYVNSHSERIDRWIADNLLTAASTTAVVRNKFLTAVPSTFACKLDSRFATCSPTGECSCKSRFWATDGCAFCTVTTLDRRQLVAQLVAWTQKRNIGVRAKAP